MRLTFVRLTLANEGVVGLVIFLLIFA